MADPSSAQETERRLAAQIRKDLEASLRGTGLEKASPAVRRRVQRALRHYAKDAARVELSSASRRYRYVSDFLETISPLKQAFSVAFWNKTFNRLGMAGRSETVDEFGLDPEFLKLWEPFMDFLFDKYWCVSTKGIENIPNEGPALVVSNHSGLLPYDGAMIASAIRKLHPSGRRIRMLAEDIFSTYPFLAPALARAGMIRACQENAERLLKSDELVGVFPEGTKGIGKYYRDRYQLQRFGRGGFIKLCLRTRSNIVPCAVVGAEEIMPILAKMDWIGRPFKLPYTPITPTAVPLPTKWSIWFGEPIDLVKYGPDAVEDDILVNRLKEQVRATIQDMIYELLAERKSVFFG